MRAIVREADLDRVHLDDLVRVQADGVAALASPRDGAPARDEAELRAHERITRAIHESAPSLPARFGSLFANDDAVASALRARRSELANALDDVGTRVEMSATISWRTARELVVPAKSDDGRAYLESRAARERERQEAQQVVARLLDGLPRKRALTSQSICPRDGVAAIVAFLVEREEVNGLRQGIASFADRSDGVTVSLYGPMPPYSFVS